MADSARVCKREGTLRPRSALLVALLIHALVHAADTAITSAPTHHLHMDIPSPDTSSLVEAVGTPYGLSTQTYNHITDPDKGTQHQQIPRTPNGVTAPRTFYHSNLDLHRSPYQVDGKCSERYCNGIPNAAYQIEDGTGVVKGGETWAESNKVNSLANTAGDCYRDSDCSFFYTDSAGKLSQEIVGRCVRRSSTQSECECTHPFFGRNCQMKHCPNATNNGLECGGPDRGTCDSSKGKCTCHQRATATLMRDENVVHNTKFYGEGCELRRCPNDCMVNGVRQGHCIAERDTQEHICRCFPAFYGSDCSKRRCPMSYRGYVCDNHGTCDMETGKCNCDAGYSHADCANWYGAFTSYHGHEKAATRPTTEVVQSHSSNWVKLAPVTNLQEAHAPYQRVPPLPGGALSGPTGPPPLPATTAIP